MTILTKEQWEASIAETWSASIKATYQHLIDEAVKAEREACAKVCDEFPDVGYVNKKLKADYHAYLIRQRGIV